MIKPWRTIGSRPLGDYRIFTLRSDRKVSPRNGSEHDVFIIDSVDWVNVEPGIMGIAFGPDGSLYYANGETNEVVRIRAFEE